MISLQRAQQLQQAGVSWQPAEHDAFAIATPGLETQVFIVSQFTALPEALNGRPAITFHGSSEWALDYVLLSDVVWLPSETQLREMLVAHLPDNGAGVLALERTAQGYCCVLTLDSARKEFHAADAAEAYGNALLYVLRAQAEA